VTAEREFGWLFFDGHRARAERQSLRRRGPAGERTPSSDQRSLNNRGRARSRRRSPAARASRVRCVAARVGRLVRALPVARRRHRPHTASAPGASSCATGGKRQVSPSATPRGSASVTRGGLFVRSRTRHRRTDDSTRSEERSAEEAAARRRRLCRRARWRVTIKPKKLRLALFGPAHDDAAFGQRFDDVFHAADFAGAEGA